MFISCSFVPAGPVLYCYPKYKLINLPDDCEPDVLGV